MWRTSETLAAAGEKEKDVELASKSPYYQIMPDTFDGGFFDWYVLERSGYQFFELRETCIINFIYYRNVWMKLKSK